MSARDIESLGREFPSLVGAYVRRLRAAFNRIGFPSAVREETDASEALTWTTGSTPSWDTVVSMVLDPGRWFMLAGTVVDHFVTGGDEFTIQYRLIVNGETTGFAVADSRGGGDSLDTDRCDPGNLSGTIVLDDESTVEWQVAYLVTTGSGPGHAHARESYLIAVPS